MVYHRFANAAQVLSCKSCCVLVEVEHEKRNQITSTHLKEQLRLVVSVATMRKLAQSDLV